MYSLTIPHRVKADQVASYVGTLSTFMRDEAQSHGNAHWELSQDEHDATAFVLYEHWPSRETFEAFAQTDVFKAFVGRMMGEWLVEPPVPHFYRIVGGSDEGKGTSRGI